MAITDEGMVMPVSPIGGGGFGNMGGDWGWIILLLLIAGNGFGFGGMNNFAADGAAIYPWMNQAELTSSGFQNAATNQAIGSLQNSVTSGFGDVQNALCGGFAGVNASIVGAQNGITQQMYSDTISNLERSFASQTATTQGFTSLQSQLAQCCCDNRLATVETRNVVEAEGAATRLAIQNQTQQILDKLCEQEIENLRQANVSLQNQVNMLNLAASQTQQTATLIADNTAQTQYLVNRISPYPIPAYTVANPVTPVI